MKEKLEDNYLYKEHPYEEIKRWVNSLEYGFYKRASGGFANDGDSFVIRLAYKNKEELFLILKRLNINLTKLPDDYSKPVLGKAYSAKEFEKFNDIISDFPEHEQVGRIMIFSIPCFSWIENGIISLSFYGAASENKYKLSELDFNNCIELEKIIKNLDLIDFVDREVDALIHYISSSNYPELFE